jgi:hypothetical protein
MSPRAREKPGELVSKTGPKRIWLLEYHALHLAQAPFTFVFWKIEQAKARLQDWIENERRRL